MEGSSKVFVPDEAHGWVGATLLRVDRASGTAEVELEADPVFGIEGGEARTVSLAHPLLQACRAEGDGQDEGGELLPLQNVGLPEEGVEDMSALSFLHEPAILFNLRRRFLACQPYTYTGDICISVNPYQWLDGLYSASLKEAYALNEDLQGLPPHVFAVSAAAFRGLRDRGEDQSILMSGESGSGKTEATKLLMAHLASISSRRASHASSSGDGDGDGSGSGSDGGDRTIERVLEANPLLESFGNAQTVRNDNSSRFGRFTQLQFRQQASPSKPQQQQQLQLVGLECVTYLLEKSRVVHHSQGERTYHVFYQLMAAPETDKARVGLGGKSVKDFRYLACDHGGSDITVIEGRSDAERYKATLRALKVIGITGEQQQTVLATLAGILYLGEVGFVGEEGAADEEARVQEEQGALQEAAGLLGCDAAALGRALCSRTVRTRHETYAVPMTPAQAVDAREALSKELYARLFAWLVARINGSTAVDMEREEAASGGVGTIGLLDIFGFESFAVNRFEQLCINYCNETLQQRFTQDVFKSVQAEYEEEGIAWEFVKFSDNAPVLELIEGRMGLITVLNEECMLAKGGDASFASKLASLHDEHPHFAKDRLNKLDFSIHHYAGSVKYTAAAFVARNRDTLLDDLSAALSQSRLPLVQALFPAPVGNGAAANGAGGVGENRKKGAGTIAAESVVTKFRRQLNQLMHTVSATRVQYIRCIKPNQAKRPDVLEAGMVVEQLRCAGVIEAIRISRAAYPNRLSHEECLRRFRLLHVAQQDQLAAGKALAREQGEEDGGTAVAEAVRRLLGEQLPELPVKGDGEERRQRWEMGRTRVYFGKGALEELEEKRLAVLGARATTVQRYFRGWRQWRTYQETRRAAVVVQSRLRAWRQRRWYVRERARVVLVQSMWRRRRDARRVQALRLQTRATAIQAAFRRHWQRARYVRLREGAVRLQALARGRAARAAFVAALAEAREQAKLENQLEALRRRLEEESEARKAAEELLQEQQQATAAAPGAEGEMERSDVGAVGVVGVGAGGSATTQALSEEQGQMLEYLRRKVLKYRDQCRAFKAETEAYKREAEALRAENQRVKDAHAAAGLSFTALNQHSANLQRVNKRLERERQAAVEEARQVEQRGLQEVQRVAGEANRAVEKVAGQLQRAREELKGKQQLCELEMQVRLKQDRTMGAMITLVQRRVGDRDPELVDELKEMRHLCSAGVLEDVAARSSLIGGLSSNRQQQEDGGVGSKVAARATKMLAGFAQFLGNAGDGGL